LDDTFHYPPDLMGLLIDAIPCLCKAKKDVLLFFRGAGVGDPLTQDLGQRLLTDREGIGKHEMVRTVLTRLNERGEATLKQRREVLKRVVEFEDFSACWPNDQLKAKALVGDIRKLINVKDSFTRMNQEREAESRQRRETAEAKRKAIEQKAQELRTLKDELFALFAMTNAWARGKKLESVLNRLFKASGLTVHESFTLTGDESQGIVEQIDGVVQIDGHVYLIEVKWWKERLGRGEVSEHLVRVFNRGHARGIFISATGYTDAGIQCCRESLHRAPFVLCELEEIVRALEADFPLPDLLKRKIDGVIIHKQPLTRVL
jgi:restriction system protein